MFSLFRPRGVYTGRLAFDPDSGFHVDPAGRKLVTDDEGRTWRYARRADTSHHFRHHRRYATFTATTEEGHAAGDPAHAHHLAPTPDDAHANGIVSHPDAVAAAQTSHTDAWKGQA